MSDNLAQRLWAARTGGGTVPLAAGDVLIGTEDAYAVQRESAALAGLPRAGWKVAATSEEALLDVHGMGPVKTRTYGDGFLAVVARVLSST